MHYYITRKGGSMIFRLHGKPRQHILAGQRIPEDCLEHLGERSVGNLIKDGAFVALPEGQEPVSEDLGEPDITVYPVGTGDKDFMPEAQALPGRQHDAALQALLDEQEARKAQTEVDLEAGGSPDGTVRVKVPDEDIDPDGLEYDEMMTDAERDAIALIEGAGDDADEE